MAGGNAQLALDRVEVGESLAISKKHTALPPGLTRGMLMKDYFGSPARRLSN